VIPPTIDPFSAKNCDLTDEEITGILTTAGLDQRGGTPRFHRTDGRDDVIRRRARVVEVQPLTGRERVVLQVSRWDRLKDPEGVLRGFALMPASEDFHLVLAGPDVEAVSDDPEGLEVKREVEAVWRSLHDLVRARVHLASLPMDDGDENAAMVNALQRRAEVVVQKSLAEGFGLTVAEAMWKSKPVVASRVGGIQDQIEDGVSGILIPDARDLATFAMAVARLLAETEVARAMGEAARERVRRQFLGVTSLMRYEELLERIASPD
jgi:trehalose synthase